MPTACWLDRSALTTSGPANRSAAGGSCRSPATRLRASTTAKPFAVSLSKTVPDCESTTYPEEVDPGLRGRSARTPSAPTSKHLSAKSGETFRPDRHEPVRGDSLLSAMLLQLTGPE